MLIRGTKIVESIVERHGDARTGVQSGFQLQRHRSFRWFGAIAALRASRSPFGGASEHSHHRVADRFNDRAVVFGDRFAQDIEVIHHAAKRCRVADLTIELCRRVGR